MACSPSKGHIWSSSDYSYKSGEWDWRCDCGELSRDFPPDEVEVQPDPLAQVREIAQEMQQTAELCERAAEDEANETAAITGHSAARILETFASRILAALSGQTEASR